MGHYFGLLRVVGALFCGDGDWWENTLVGWGSRGGCTV